MDKVMKLTYSSSLTRFSEMNPSFDIAKLRIAYHGKNRNGSFISKEAFERAVPSMYNCPVVCRYDRDSDSIGSHDIEVIKDQDGNYQIVNVTTPVGVVPESAQWYWETVTEPDGESHEYITTDILLWKRQEAYKKILEDGIEAQSMEIEVKDGWRNKSEDVFVIEDFIFTAFCLLGENTEPCFESAEVEVYSMNMDNFKEKLTAMMNDLKETYSAFSTAVGGVEINNIITEGGNDLDEKLALVNEYGLVVDDLDFALDDYTVEELKEKFEAMKADPVCDSDAEVPASEDAAAFALEGDIRNGLREAVYELGTVETPWGPEAKYWFVDYDKDLSEVYAESSEDWNLYGFTYSMNGDNVIIDENTRKRMKWVVAEFDEGEDVTPFANIFSSITDKYTANDNAWSEKFQKASATIETMTEELTTLRKFKSDADEAAMEDARNEVFSRFEDLVGVEAFETLKENRKQFDLETLEEKCFAIRGRNSTKATFSYEAKLPKTKVNHNAHNDEPYGGMFVEYGIAD